MNSAKTFVLGAGAIGSLVAHELRMNAPHGIPPTLLFRNIQRLEHFCKNTDDGIGDVDELGRKGELVVSHLYSSNPFTARSRLNVAVAPPIDGGHVLNIENLIIVTKTFQTFLAIEPYISSLAPNANIVILQNGMGMASRLEERFWSQSVVKPNFFEAITTHGAFKSAPNIVQHAAEGTILLLRYLKESESGDVSQLNTVLPMIEQNESSNVSSLESIPPINEQNEFSNVSSLESISSITEQNESSNVSPLEPVPPIIEQIVSCSRLNATFIDRSSFLTAQMEKLVVNACINPLTSIYDCLNGDLLLGSGTSFLMRRIIIEAWWCLKAEYPHLTQSGEHNDSVEIDRLLEMVLHVCKATAKNSSSMREDMRHLNTTEISSFNGHIANLGRKHGIRTPTNVMLVQMVKSKLSIQRAVDEKASMTIVEETS